VEFFVIKELGWGINMSRRVTWKRKVRRGK
jgi:hypothetical protein